MYEAHEILFRSFRLDVENEQLWQGQQPVALRPKTFAVLRHLVQRAGRLVTKEELLNAVWPGTTVSDVVPIVCVRELRKALGDAAKAPRFIETLARRGYRFIAPLTTAPLVVSSQHSVVSSPHLPTQSSVLSPQHSVLVGREAELAKLHQLLGRALNGERQIVFISGEAGIGKTALLDTFLHQLSEIWIGRGQCIEQHGDGEAYLPLLDVTGRICREPRGQGLIEILRQYAPAWLIQFPSLLSATDMEALQRKTMGATHERMLREMAEAMEVATATHPFVLVLEDLHWCDASTLDFLAFLACRRDPACLLVIGTYRPAELPVSGHSLSTLTHELSLHRQCEEIVLPLLTQAEVAAYLDLRFPPELRAGLPLATLASCLYQRTDGNPLFLINVADYLIARGSEKGEGSFLPSVEDMLEVVPQNLQQMIEKQIERLTPEDQQMLEVASAAGVEFSAAAVAAGVESDVVEVEERCRALARRGRFLWERGIEEWSDGTVATSYSFIHSLYQHVLYQRVTGARSARLHLRIGIRIEEGCGEQTRENAAVLARHFALGRDYRRAVQYLHQAAENAVWRCAFQEANAHFAKGVELLHHWPDSPDRTRQEQLLHLAVIGPLMALKGEASSEVEHSYTQIIKLHQQLGANEMPFLVLLGLWMVRLVRGELAAAQELAEQMMTQAESEKDPLVQLWAHLTGGICAFYRGDFTAAHTHFMQEAILYETQQHPQYLLDPKMVGLSFDSLTSWVLGHADLALQQSQAAVTWAQGLSHPYNEVAALVLAAWLHVSRREGDTAEEQVDVLLPGAQAHGFVQYVAIGTLFRGCALVEQRQSDEGVPLMFQGINAMHAAKARFGMSAWQGLLAAALGNLERIGEALEAMAEAETAMHNSGERFFAAELYRIKGEILLAQESTEQGARSREPKAKIEKGERAKGRKGEEINVAPSPDLPVALSSPEECFLKAIDLARQQQAKLLELRAVMSLVRLRQQQAAEQGAAESTEHGAGSREHGARSREQGAENREQEAGNALADAHRMLSEVYGWFTEGFETVDLQEAKGLLGELGGDRL